MPLYVVSWEIEIEADDVLDAAANATYLMQTDPQMTASCTVIDERGETYQVELPESEDARALEVAE